MKALHKQFLFDLLKTPSPTGYETSGQRIWLKHVRKNADDTETDAYGNAWATIKGRPGAKSIMLEAHADEIGYVVKYINKEGFLSIDLIGGSDCATARGRFVTLYCDKGEVPGVIGNTAIHIRERKDEKAPKVHELFVDVGAKSDKDVHKMGIRVGTPVIYTDSVHELGKETIAGRAIDNRVGGFIVARVIENLGKKQKPTWTVYGVNAVQEEVGGYGARMTAHRLTPDCALVFDVTHATDSPGIKQEQHSKVLLREGPTVTHGNANHPLIVERLMEVAKKKKIAFQHEATSRYSGTDTDQIYPVKEGIPSALVSVPVRYMHSAVELIDLTDIEKAIDLLTAFVLSLKEKDEFRVKI